jgi:hypothetical protein
MVRDFEAEPFAAAVDPGLDRAHVGTHERRDFLVVEAVEVREDDGLALFERDAEEGVLQFASEFKAFREDRGARAGVSQFEWRAVIIRACVQGVGWSSALAAAEFVLAFIGGNAEEPTADAAFGETRDRAVRGEECFLRGVLGRFGVPQKAQTKVVDDTLIALNKTVECLKAAVL